MEWDTLTQNHRIVLVTSGGASSSISSSGDKIRSLANQFSSESEVFKVYGTPAAVGQHIQARVIANKIDDLCDEIRNNGHTPIIILVGKSMGGCVLHKVSQKLNSEIQLFIGVDMSCTVSCHYRKYKEGETDQAKRFDNQKVKELINFFQLEGYQCGHPAIYEGQGLNETSINIDVNAYKYDMDDKVRVDRDAIRGLVCNSVEIILPRGYSQPDLCNSGLDWMNHRVDTYEIKFEYRTNFNNIYNLCSGADHDTIDSCSGLLTVIKRLIREAAILPLDDNTEYPKYSVSYSIPPAEDPITIFANRQLEQEDGDKVINIDFIVGSGGTESYERKLTINLIPNNCEDSILIKLKKPAIEAHPFIHSMWQRILYGTIPKTMIADACLSDDFSDVEVVYPTADLDSSGLTELEKEDYWNRRVYVDGPPIGAEREGNVWNHFRVKYRLGYVTAPIKAEIKEEALLGRISHEGETYLTNPLNPNMKIELRSWFGASPDRELELDQVMLPLDSFEFFNGFSRNNYDQDHVLNFDYRARDQASQVASGQLQIFAKSLLCIRRAVYGPPLVVDPIRFRVKEDIGVLLKINYPFPKGIDINQKQEISSFIDTIVEELVNQELKQLETNSAVWEEISQSNLLIGNSIKKDLIKVLYAEEKYSEAMKKFEQLNLELTTRTAQNTAKILTDIIYTKIEVNEFIKKIQKKFNLRPLTGSL